MRKSGLFRPFRSCRYRMFTGDTDLTFPAAVTDDSVGAVRRKTVSLDIRTADQLIFSEGEAPGLIDRADRTAPLAGPAHRTVRKGIAVFAFRPGKDSVCHDTSEAAGHSFFCDQSSGESECSKPRRVSDMPFRPVGAERPRHTELRRVAIRKKKCHYTVKL